MVRKSRLLDVLAKLIIVMRSMALILMEQD